MVGIGAMAVQGPGHPARIVHLLQAFPGGAQVTPHVTRNMGVVADTRNCEQCGAPFAPRREHARFCSARCRVAWNRLYASSSPAEGGALAWTITAMRDTIDRLLRAKGWDQPHAFAIISEAVWWVTMVDATLVRYHPDAYDGVRRP